MKLYAKQLLTAALVLALLLVLTVPAFAASGKKINKVTQANQTYLYTQDAHPLNGNGPISITEGTLYRGGKKCKIYLVAMHGTETSAIGSSVDTYNDGLAGSEQEGPYMREIMAAMKEVIPKDANVILAGHSLGGMVGQQIAADKAMQKRYNIINIITWGSPLICGGKVEGELHRLCDTGDLVPYMGSNVATEGLDAAYDSTRHEEHWKEGTIFNTHPQSYGKASVWGKYDAVGVKGGDAVLKMDDSTTRFFQAPAIEGMGQFFEAHAAYKDGTNWSGAAILI